MFLFDVLKKCKKELIFKIITSIIIQGLLLIIPVYWSNTINHVTNGIYDKAIKYFIKQVEDSRDSNEWNKQLCEFADKLMESSKTS